MSALDIEAKCKEIYREAQEFFHKNPRPFNFGFKILNSPPHYRPPVMSIEYQPNSSDDDFERETLLESDKHWPTICEYATESWPLAEDMRRMFGRPLLEQCIGINAIFLRAPNVDYYKQNLDKTMREKVEEFCLVRTEKIVEMVEPKQIVAIGFDTLELFGESEADIRSDSGRLLTRFGKIANRSAIATLHLSRTYIQTRDFYRIRDRVRSVRTMPGDFKGA